MPIDYSIPPILRSTEDRQRMASDIQEILVETYRDFGVFCKTWLPARFDQPYTSLHRQVISFINDLLREQQKRLIQGRPPGMKGAIKGARGTAKTSFCIHGLGARQILFNQSRYIVPITKSEKNSIAQTENLREVLVEDTYIKKIFGDIRHTQHEDLDSVFSKTIWDAFVAGEGTRVHPRGVGQQVRGLQYSAAGHRPDCLLLDDIDDDKWLLNEELREWYHSNWFPGAVLKCVSQFEAERVPWLVIVMDSCKHEACLVEKLVPGDGSDPRAGWEGLTISVCDQDYKTLAPDFISQESLDQEIADARHDGTLDVTARELMSIPAAPEGKPFLASNFRYFDPEPGKINWDAPGMQHFVTVDPANTTSPKSDYTAIIGASVDFDNWAIFFREIINERLHPYEIAEEAIKMAQRMKAYHIGVEFGGLKLHIEAPLRDAIMTKGLFHLELIELKPQTGRGEASGHYKGKTARIIWALSHFYKAGRIYHHPDNCHVLESQLLMLPRGAHDDAADAASYLIQLLETLGLSFYEDRPEVLSKIPEDKSFRTPIEDLLKEEDDLFPLDKPIELLELEGYAYASQN